MSEQKPYWKPNLDTIHKSNIYQFMTYVNRRYGLSLNKYFELHSWSVNNIEDFWSAISDYFQVIYSVKSTSVINKENERFKKIPRPVWFEGAKLNFAENLLRFRDKETAIIYWTENKPALRISFEELYLEVARLAFSLRNLGVQKGDVVAGYISNSPEAVIAMLATTSIGAVWTSCSPDFGAQGVIDRFGQTKPKILLAVNGYSYNGKVFDNTDKIEEVRRQIPEMQNVVIIDKVEISNSLVDDYYLSWNKLMDNPASELIFEQTEFDHPLYIMYSSGTTGVPKCIVHGAGGTLLQHLKELGLHCGINRDDNVSYFTTCGWMMWNWLVSSLGLGASIFLYDGSPSYPDMKVLWKAVEKEDISIFGTSPKFLSACQSMKVVPTEQFDFIKLRMILSTGSPLLHENYEYVYTQVKPDVHLSSISGGTDIISCFMLGNPMMAVYSEEIQAPGLGMNVKAFDDAGSPLKDKKGELVCTNYFPSMPIYFWNDPEDEKYYSAYFENFKGIWRHGDFIRITERGGIVVYGRSDATLNPGGVRIGTAEIYNAVESISFVDDSIVVGQNWKGDVRVVLFVVLKNNSRLDSELSFIIKEKIKNATTPRHVPSVVIQVPAIPVTMSGKKVELAVTQVIHGEEVKNISSIANPEALDFFRQIKW